MPESGIDRLTGGKMKTSTARRGLDALGTVFKLSRLPLVSRVHPWLRPDKTDMRWLPINEDIQLPGDAPMPLNLLDRFIEEASHRVIYKECGCRAAFECKSYPIDLGCLLMGDSAVEGSSSSCREVTVREAKEHSRRAVEAGLVPVVGKARVDNFLFGIKDRSRLLTVCFCCECCCITRFTRNVSMKTLEPMFPRLHGVTVEVNDDCIGCGECAEHCYIKAIEIVDGKAVIGEYCRACGRCATVCPEDAIEVRIDDPDFLDNAYDRIRSYVKFD
jgi:ferredoxin